MWALLSFVKDVPLRLWWDMKIASDLWESGVIICDNIYVGSDGYIEHHIF